MTSFKMIIRTWSSPEMIVMIPCTDRKTFTLDVCSSEIYIYKEECLSVCLYVCLSVCLFAMHSGPVIATVTKLSMALP